MEVGGPYSLECGECDPQRLAVTSPQNAVEASVPDGECYGAIPSLAATSR